MRQNERMTEWTRKRLTTSALGWLTAASAKSSLAIQKEPAKIHITLSGTGDATAGRRVNSKGGKGRTEEDRLSPIGRVASVRRRVEHTLRDGDGARDGRTECWQRTASYDLERPPFKSSVSAIIGSAEQRIFC